MVSQAHLRAERALSLHLHIITYRGGSQVSSLLSFFLYFSVQNQRQAIKHIITRIHPFTTLKYWYFCFQEASRLKKKEFRSEGSLDHFFCQLKFRSSVQTNVNSLSSHWREISTFRRDGQGWVRSGQVRSGKHPAQRL